MNLQGEGGYAVHIFASRHPSVAHTVGAWLAAGASRRPAEDSHWAQQRCAPARWLFPQKGGRRGGGSPARIAMTPARRRPLAAFPAPSRPAATPGGAGSERAVRYAKSDLAWTDSDYLCPFCHDPLYVEDRTAEEACFNRACTAYVDRGESSEYIGSQEWAQGARKRCAEGIRQFYRFDRAFLLQMLFKARVRESKQLFQGMTTSCNTASSIDYLLTRLDRSAAWGGSRDAPSCLRVLQQHHENFDVLLVAERFCSKYYISTAGDGLYIMKYDCALEKFHKTLGIVNEESRHDRAGCYLFESIDRQSGGPVEGAFDFEAVYSLYQTGISQLSHTFRMAHAVSQIHQYPAGSEDFVVLLSVWTQCTPGATNSITEEGLRGLYDDAMQKNKMRGDFDQFLVDYTSGREYAPILVFDGEKYHFEYHDLLFYLMYLQSNNRTLSGRQTATGQAICGGMKQAAASAFEEQIRQKLRNDGFDVFPTPSQGQLYIPSKKTGKEFDCLAVDRPNRVIVIIEAKYEDIAPSSKAAVTMIDQLVLDRKRGLLEHAKRHHERRRLVKRHFGSLKNFGLGLEGSFLDYTVHAVIVTKHEPLISRHMGVDIISYERFASVDFRRRGSLTCPIPPPNPSQAPGAPPNAAPGSGPCDGVPAVGTTTTATTGGVRVGMPAPRTPKGEIGARPPRCPPPDEAAAIAARPGSRACRQVREADGPDGTAAIAAVPHFQATALITASGCCAPHGLAPHLPVLRRQGPAKAPRPGRGKAGRQDSGYGPVAEGAKIEAVVPPLQRVHDRLHPRRQGRRGRGVRPARRADRGAPGPALLRGGSGRV